VKGVVARARFHAFKLQSDFARQMAPFVATAASRGFITNYTDGQIHDCWVVTVRGLQFLEDENANLTD
jgi:hypothetical protein